MATETKSIHCPQCGGAQKTDLGNSRFRCANCDSDYVVEQDEAAPPPPTGGWPFPNGWPLNGSFTARQTTVENNVFINGKQVWPPPAPGPEAPAAAPQPARPVPPAKQYSPGLRKAALVARLVLLAVLIFFVRQCMLNTHRLP